MTRIMIEDMRLAKSKASTLKTALQVEGIHRTLTECQASVAEIYGYATWAELKTVVEAPATTRYMSLGRLDPVVVGCVLAGRFGATAAAAARVAMHVRFSDVRSAPAGKTFEDIVRRADAAGWRDIHVEPCESGIDVRFGTTDGPRARILQPVAGAVLSRIAELAEAGTWRGAGRIALEELPDTEIRTSTYPTDHGDGWAMRILKHHPAGPGRAAISAVPEHWKLATSQGSGIVVVTGPAGADKESVLMAMREEMARSGETEVRWCIEPVVTTVVHSGSIPLNGITNEDLRKYFRPVRRSVFIMKESSDPFLESAFELSGHGDLVVMAMDDGAETAMRRMKETAARRSVRLASILRGMMVMSDTGLDPHMPAATWVQP